MSRMRHGIGSIAAPAFGFDRIDFSVSRVERDDGLVIIVETTTDRRKPFGTVQRE